MFFYKFALESHYRKQLIMWTIHHQNVLPVKEGKQNLLILCSSSSKSAPSLLQGSLLKVMWNVV